MHEETYDVVDESGNKIRTTSWEEIHGQGLLHQGAGVLIFKNESHEELLLQKLTLQVLGKECIEEMEWEK